MAEMSAESLAEQLNVVRGTYGKYETGESEPTFEQVVWICQILDISADWLLGTKK